MTAPPPVRRDPLRNAGFVACLIGVLAMISGRYATGAPVWLVYVGVSGIVFGWGLFGLAAWRRADFARMRARETKD
jgi:uncharacterized membrane protein